MSYIGPRQYESDERAAIARMAELRDKIPYPDSLVFRNRLHISTGPWVWPGRLPARQIESRKLAAWWAAVPEKTKCRHARDIAREKRQAARWTKRYEKKLPGIDAGRKLDVVSLDEFLKNTKIVYLEENEAKSVTMTTFEPVADANVAVAQHKAAMHGRTTPHKETLYPPEEHCEPRDVLVMPTSRQKSDALLMLVLLKELRNANKADDTMSDAKLAAYIRKRALRSKWPGPKETPDLLQQRTMRQLRKITMKQLCTRRAYLQSIRAVPSPIPAPPDPEPDPIYPCKTLYSRVNDIPNSHAPSRI